MRAAQGQTKLIRSTVLIHIIEFSNHIRLDVRSPTLFLRQLFLLRYTYVRVSLLHYYIHIILRSTLRPESDKNFEKY